MFKKSMAIAIALAMSAGSVVAQTPCSVGVYADRDGLSSVVTPAALSNFDVYVVLFAESLANAASYQVVAEGLGTDFIQVGAVFGPTGDGLSIILDGYNVALGECAIGYNGAPILVAKYTFLQLDVAAPSTSISITGGREDPDFPVFSTCSGVLITCESGPSLTVDNAVSTENDSFGAVKNLFRD
jgi:hypothetical protein